MSTAGGSVKCRTGDPSANRGLKVLAAVSVTPVLHMSNQIFQTRAPSRFEESRLASSPWQLRSGARSPGATARFSL